MIENTNSVHGKGSKLCLHQRSTYACNSARGANGAPPVPAFERTNSGKANAGNQLVAAPAAAAGQWSTGAGTFDLPMPNPAPKTKREARAAAEKLLGPDTSTPRQDGWPSRSSALYAGAPNHASRRTRTVANDARSGARAGLGGRDLHRGVIRMLGRTRDQNRAFAFVDISGDKERIDLGVVSFLLTSNIEKQAEGLNIKPFCLLTFCARRAALKYESSAVQQFADLGWPVARECVETLGHGIERLEKRLKKLGW